MEPCMFISMWLLSLSLSFFSFHVFSYFKRCFASKFSKYSEAKIAQFEGMPFISVANICHFFCLKWIYNKECVFWKENEKMWHRMRRPMRKTERCKHFVEHVVSNVSCGIYYTEKRDKSFRMMIIKTINKGTRASLFRCGGKEFCNDFRTQRIVGQKGSEVFWFVEKSNR